MFSIIQIDGGKMVLLWSFVYFWINPFDWWKRIDSATEKLPIGWQLNSNYMDHSEVLKKRNGVIKYSTSLSFIMGNILLTIKTPRISKICIMASKIIHTASRPTLGVFTIAHDMEILATSKSTSRITISTILSIKIMVHA